MKRTSRQRTPLTGRNYAGGPTACSDTAAKSGGPVGSRSDKIRHRSAANGGQASIRTLANERFSFWRTRMMSHLVAARPGRPEGTAGPPERRGAWLASSTRSGLTLFEVVISLAIFMGALAAIGQLISNGARGAVYAKLQTQAVIRCETTLGEVLAGYITLRSTSGTFPDNPAWSWSVSVAPTQHEGLYIVEVTAAHAGQSSLSKASYTLRRFIRDPGLEMQAYENQLALQQSQGTTSGSSTSGAGK